MTDITEYQLVWKNITIAITHTKKWCGGDIDHIEVKSISPEKAPLPITETGYRSHFHHVDSRTGYSDAKE